ncbi:MAG TPA: hypothetical protein PLK17_12665 [Bacteroidales bacterium]|jgi:hypothetical protein|nr:hypothetical protein [Bacteroidales bacterium]HPJ06356.1 hypothetical protein [Bacteroidales bacterium]HPQ65049.1 hypothetical protein [Bacteroidales bacterium]
MFVDMHCDEDVCITIGNGTNMSYYAPFKEHPEKHQLLLEFDDGSFVVYTVAMYGGIWAFKGVLDNSYHLGSLNKISPLDDSFGLVDKMKIRPLFASVALALFFALIHFVFYKWIFLDRGIIGMLTHTSLFMVGFVRNSLILMTGHIGYSWALHLG